ncbi:hypothetical protein OIU74_008507 [Salix koriyanagi]|uniref:Uncharacterized protein n=1 Tax=Salix koriyanagi TaxID=2511006 RepID=A0A9Q0TQ85_9ROSI|nr:hypothetical protein OIU74_008507 [Salix koriyanagi]
MIIYRNIKKKKGTRHSTSESKIRNRSNPFIIRVVRSGTNLAAIKLAKDMESSDKANEAETDHQNYCGRDLQARRIIGVESEYVAARASGYATATTAGGGSGGYDAATTHPSSGGSGAARSRDSSTGR